MGQKIINYFLLTALGLFLFVGRVWCQQSYEAESAKLSNGAHVDSRGFCVGGKEVSGIGDRSNGSVTFETIPVSVEGLYRMTVYYITGDDRSFTVTVNDRLVTESIFYTTAGNNGVSTKVLLIPLQKGLNRICFNKADEGAPGLDRITISDRPEPSAALDGKVTDAAGHPLPGVTVILSGDTRRQTVTDASGNYRIASLAKGSYELTPQMKNTCFSPYSRLVKLATTDKKLDNFKARPIIHQLGNQVSLQSGEWKILYDKTNGTATFCKGAHQILTDVYALVKIPQTISSMDYPEHRLIKHPLRDQFGKGTVYRIISTGKGLPEMTQTFWLYDHLDYFLTSVKLESKKEIRSNYMAPLVTCTGSAPFPSGDNRSLFVPFDNDKWVRYHAYPFGSGVTAYEVSSWYNNESRNGLVIGSVEHSTWKTGVRSVTSADAITRLEVFGGVTGTKTRDVLPHGKVSGLTVSSPKIFIGYFSDWRKGLETYAETNAVITPARKWTKGVPFGWNSWGKIQFGINYDKAVQVSDYFEQHLQPDHFENNSIVYIGLDAGWDHLNDDQLKAFVEHCKKNHQEAGIYFGPFTAWGGNGNQQVEGSNYKYSDIYLYANGKQQYIDGGIAVDPTHPGTEERIKYDIDRFKKAGFKYLKIDFLVHGALEADHYYNKDVTTGMEAYNEGMKFLCEVAGDDLYINAAISPLFPGCYANSRRIGCDSWGAISQTEYSLNALSYGWWLGGNIYDYNDADHVVLDGYSEAENRSRVTSSVITGIFILGDDFSKTGSDEGKERALKYVTNPDIDHIARIEKPFYPVEGNTGNSACNLFQYEDTTYWYVVAFNYSDQETSERIPLQRLNIPSNKSFGGKELWRGKELSVLKEKQLNFNIAPRDVLVFRINKK